MKTRQTSAELEREVQRALAQETPSQEMPAVGSTLRLGQKTYIVERSGTRAIDLRGTRGGRYTLIQNQHNPTLWALIPGGRMKPKAEWFQREPSGGFESVVVA